MTKEIQTRTVSFENKANNDMILEGYAAVFDKPTILYENDGIEYKEIISPTAFRDTEFKDCYLKYNHEGSVPALARYRGGSLELNPDHYGLYFKAKLFDTSIARDVYKLVQQGGLDKCSFAFTIAPDGASYDRETRTRTIHKIDRLYDVAIVDVPAYEETIVQARSFFDMEIEKEALDKAVVELRQRRLKLILEIKERIKDYE